MEYGARKHPPRMLRMLRWGRMSLEMRALLTNQEWLQAFQASGKRVATCRIKPAHYHYSRPPRAYIIVDMRYQDIERLRISVFWTSSQVREVLVPDRVQWLLLWRTSVAVCVCVCGGGGAQSGSCCPNSITVSRWIFYSVVRAFEETPGLIIAAQMPWHWHAMPSATSASS